MASRFCDRPSHFLGSPRVNSSHEDYSHDRPSCCPQILPDILRESQIYVLVVAPSKREFPIPICPFWCLPIRPRYPHPGQVLLPQSKPAHIILTFSSRRSRTAFIPTPATDCSIFHVSKVDSVSQGLASPPTATPARAFIPSYSNTASRLVTTTLGTALRSRAGQVSFF